MRTAKFDKVALGELEVSLLGSTSAVVGKFKLVSTTSGMSFGSTTIRIWGPAVMEKLKELQQLMEEEVEGRLFEDDGDRSAVEEVGGIGEQFGNEPPSI